MPTTAKDVADAFGDALKNLMTLRVTTIVGPIQVTSVDDNTGKCELVLPGANAGATDCATTSINLLAGDITEVRTPKFVEDPTYSKMHDDALNQAKAVIANNLAALQSAFAGIQKFLTPG